MQLSTILKGLSRYYLSGGYDVVTEMDYWGLAMRLQFFSLPQVCCVAGPPRTHSSRMRKSLHSTPQPLTWFIPPVIHYTRGNITSDLYVPNNTPSVPRIPPLAGLHQAPTTAKSFSGKYTILTVSKTSRSFAAALHIIRLLATMVALEVCSAERGVITVGSITR